MRAIVSKIRAKDEIILAHRGWLRCLWLEMRPKHWVKNLFVLAPLLFAKRVFETQSVLTALTAFSLFCLVSSSVYYLNDIKDYGRDRVHQVKRRRPIAAGDLDIRLAAWVMIGLLVLSVCGGLMLSKAFALVLLSYWFINLLYSQWLKYEVILDVFAIAAGFVLRVVGGGLAIGVELSQWLILCTTLLALFLGFGKRRHELLLLGTDAKSHRQVLGEYSSHFLDMMIGIVTASTVMSYALYTLSEETAHKFHTRGLILTLPFVLYGIFRYLYLIYQKDQGGDPTQNLLADRAMIINLGLWAITAGGILFI